MSNIKRLIDVVINKSQSKDWDIAVKEWYCKSNFKNNGVCECGHSIIENYIIKNKVNDNELIVGSTCVKKFNNLEMDQYVDEVERKYKDVLKLQRLKAKEELKYNKLKQDQIDSKIPMSVRKQYLQKRYDIGIINKFEFDFYNSIYWKINLTDKQQSLKLKINNKIL